MKNDQRDQGHTKGRRPGKKSLKKVEKLIKAAFIHKGNKEDPAPNAKWRSDVMREIRLLKPHDLNMNTGEAFGDMFQRVVFKMSPGFVLAALLLSVWEASGDIIRDEIISAVMYNDYTGYNLLRLIGV